MAKTSVVTREDVPRMANIIAATLRPPPLVSRDELRSEAATILLEYQLGKPAGASVYFTRLKVARWARTAMVSRGSVKDPELRAETGQDAADDGTELLEQVAPALDDLEMRILIARVFEDMTFVEIADEIGMTPDGAAKAFRRGIRKAKKEIGQWTR